MSPEAQRIAIAEARGWRKTVIPNSRYACGSHGCQHDAHIKWEHENCRYSPNLHEGRVDTLPDYLTDLNAMHEAENLLSDEAFRQYTLNLEALYFDKTRGRSSRGAYSATAAERAKILLQTLELWDATK